MRAVDGKQEIYLEWPKSNARAIAYENNQIILDMKRPRLSRSRLAF